MASLVSLPQIYTPCWTASIIAAQHVATSGFRRAWFSPYHYGRASPILGLFGRVWIYLDRLRRSSKPLRVERTTTPTTTPTRATSPDLHRSSWRGKGRIFHGFRIPVNGSEPSKGSS